MVVSKVQASGVPGRFIGENDALRTDIVDYINFSNVHAAILSLDQEKAFDRVDWSFMPVSKAFLSMGLRHPFSPISQYADDTSLIGNYDDATLAVFDTYSGFEAASGTKLNDSKSKVLWLGAWNNRRDPWFS